RGTRPFLAGLGDHPRIPDREDVRSQGTGALCQERGRKECEEYENCDETRRSAHDMVILVGESKGGEPESQDRPLGGKKQKIKRGPAESNVTPSTRAACPLPAWEAERRLRGAAGGGHVPSRSSRGGLGGPAARWCPRFRSPR